MARLLRFRSFDSEADTARRLRASLSRSGVWRQASRGGRTHFVAKRSSILIDDAIIAAAQSAISRGAYLPAIEYLKPLTENDDGAALKLKADALEKLGRTADVVTALRRLYFYAPDSQESSDVTSRLVSLGSTVLPVTAAEQKARADSLYDAELWVLAAQAYECSDGSFLRPRLTKSGFAMASAATG
jgi:hypothetical protein